MIDLCRVDGAAFHPDRASVLVAVEDGAANVTPCRVVSLVMPLHSWTPSETLILCEGLPLALPCRGFVPRRLLCHRRVGECVRVGAFLSECVSVCYERLERAVTLAEMPRARRPTFARVTLDASVS